MLSGLLLIACGLGLLASARPFARDTGAACAHLMREWRDAERVTARTNRIAGLALGWAALLTGVALVLFELAG